MKAQKHLSKRAVVSTILISTLLKQSRTKDTNNLELSSKNLIWTIHHPCVVSSLLTKQRMLVISYHQQGYIYYYYKSKGYICYYQAQMDIFDILTYLRDTLIVFL